MITKHKNISAHTGVVLHTGISDGTGAPPVGCPAQYDPAFDMTSIGGVNPTSFNGKTFSYTNTVSPANLVTARVKDKSINANQNPVVQVSNDILEFPALFWLDSLVTTTDGFQVTLRDRDGYFGNMSAIVDIGGIAGVYSSLPLLDMLDGKATKSVLSAQILNNGNTLNYYLDLGNRIIPFASVDLTGVYNPATAVELLTCTRYDYQLNQLLTHTLKSDVSEIDTTKIAAGSVDLCGNSLGSGTLPAQTNMQIFPYATDVAGEAPTITYANNFESVTFNGATAKQFNSAVSVGGVVDYTQDFNVCAEFILDKISLSELANAFIFKSEFEDIQNSNLNPIGRLELFRHSNGVDYRIRSNLNINTTTIPQADVALGSRIGLQIEKVGASLLTRVVFKATGGTEYTADDLSLINNPNAIRKTDLSVIQFDDAATGTTIPGFTVVQAGTFAITGYNNITSAKTILGDAI